MRKTRTPPLLVGAARLFTTMALLTVLALVAVYLAQPSIMAASGARAAGPDFAAIDAYVEAEMQAQGIPSLALGIVQGDQIVHLKGFGIADPSGRAVTPQTPFILGSTSKSFTALAVMQLVEAGKIELDAPVQRYIPWFRVADEAAAAQITVRHLLNQTSGFSTAAGRQDSIDFDPSTEALENRVRRLREVELTQPVGAIYQYSNCNLALGHRYWFGLPLAFDEPFPRGSVSQGFIISSAEDMTHYLSAHLNEGRFGGVSVLSPAGIAELHRPAVEPNDGESVYGMGWEVGLLNNDTAAIWHDGDTFSFHSFMALMPEERWGVVVLSNASNIPATARFQAIVPGVINLLAGRQPIAEAVYDSLIVHSVVVGLVVVQVIGMIRSVALFRRWRSQPQHRPRSWLRRSWHIGLPFMLNLLWALLILMGLPRLFAPLPALMLGIPDLGYLLVASGLVALGWSPLRTVWVYFALRERGATETAGTPVTV